MGVVVWPMIELEADDALASAAHSAATDERVQKVCIWTPDKDLAQCVDGDRVVQVDRKTKTIRDAAGVREKFGVEPALNSGLPRSRRRCRRWLSWTRRHRPRVGSSAAQPLWPH